MVSFARIPTLTGWPAVVQHPVHPADRCAGSARQLADFAVHLALQQAPCYIIALFHGAELRYSAEILKKSNTIVQIIQPQDGFIQSSAAGLPVGGGSSAHRRLLIYCIIVHICPAKTTKMWQAITYQF